MNFNFAEKISPSLEDFNFDAALQIAEAELKMLPFTAFHAVCKRSQLHLTPRLAAWIDDFYHLAKKRCKVCALYFELNEFDTNTDAWFWIVDGEIIEIVVEPEVAQYLVDESRKYGVSAETIE